MVGSIFKSRSVKERDSHARTSNSVEKTGWSSVRLYFCGNECSSVLLEKDFSGSVTSSNAIVTQPEVSSVVAEDNSASLKSSEPATSSEPTVNQPILGEVPHKGNTKSNEAEDDTRKEKQNSAYKLSQKEDAAVIIQSAFRSYLAKRQSNVIEFDDGKQELVEVIQSPESVGTSIKVQTGDSSETSSFQMEGNTVRQPIQKIVKSQVLKLQEDWDDSIVSSTTLKMRMQNRIEAATRRERALAYAFAQQLRVCGSKKRRTKSDCLDTNTSWSWLERWMATRGSENLFTANNMSKKLELQSCRRETTFTRKLMDIGVEEESCGSNEVSLQIDSISVTGQRNNDAFSPVKSKSKERKNISRRKTAPSRGFLNNPKARKKNFQEEDEKDGNKDNSKQSQSRKEIPCQDSFSNVT